MNKINPKVTAEREAKYLPYKSYHNSKQRSSKSSSQEEPKLSISSDPPKVKKSSKKSEYAAVVRQVSGYKGDNVADGGLSESSRAILKHSESQTSEASLRDYEKLQDDVKSLEKTQVELSEEMMQLKISNEGLKMENENLQHTIAALELKNEELQDQYELNSDQIEELLRSNEEKAHLLKELELSVSNIENEKKVAKTRNEELERDNEELMKLMSELHCMTAEKDRTVDELSGFRKKWENYKIKFQDAMIEKQKLANQIANDAKFVALLETDMNELQEKNQELKDKNDQLQRNVTERKKNEELLRQKYDELKKQNRALKEKSSRCLVYDDVGKIGSSSLSSVIGREDTSNKDLRALSSSLMNTLSQKSMKSQDSVRREQAYYNLLHRKDFEHDLKKKKF